jgi:hypothetical protein
MKRLVTSIIAALAIAASACARASDPEPAPAQIPPHIPTWAFDEKFSQGESASAPDVQRVLTYALGGLGNDKAVRDCGNSGKCFSVFYFDPSLVYDSAACPFSADKQVLAIAHEDWFIHLPGYDDKAHRVQGTYMQNCKGTRIQIPVYELNQTNPAVAGYFADYLQRNADPWNYYEMDDTSSTLVTQFYGPGGAFCKASSMAGGFCAQTREIADDDALHRAHTTFASALKHTDGKPMEFFYNGINFGPQGPRIILLHQPQFEGALCENCVVSAGSFRTTMYAKTLDAMARVNEIDGKQFVELSTGSAPAGSDAQIAQRLVTTAVAWLGFKDGHTVVWPDLETNTHNLAVWPEDEIYPARAFQSMQKGPGDLEVAPSVWRREFASCYRNTAEIGPCASVLNGSASPVRVSPSWFRSRFSHALGLRGGDTLSGGSLDFTGSTSDVTIAPGHAVLLVR